MTKTPRPDRGLRHWATLVFFATPMICCVLLLASVAFSAQSGAPSPGGSKLQKTLTLDGSPSDQDTPQPQSRGREAEPSPEIASRKTQSQKTASSASHKTPIVVSLTVFVLAVFVGFEVITKVPPTLHTPLMSGSNAISGITLVGAVIVAGQDLGFAALVGMVAVALASVNAVGGFLVTHRMLSMFKRR